MSQELKAPILTKDLHLRLDEQLDQKIQQLVI